jgi:peptide/nickel transport system permease protein
MNSAISAVDEPADALELPHERASIRRYVVKQFLIYLFTLWAAVTWTYFAFHLIPGDPMRIYFGQLSRTQGQVDAEEAEAIIAYYREQFGLDEPLHVQYLLFLRNIASGFDLGPSFVAYPTPTRDLIMRHLPWTLGLVTTSIVIAWLIGTSLGSLLVWLRNSRFVNVAVIFATLIQTVPVYLIALGLIIYVGFNLRLLPARGPYAAHLQPAFTWEFISSVITHAILPMTSLIVVYGAGFTLGMRSLMVSVLGEDYLTYAKAKGLKSLTILKDYAFRNALIPQVAGLAIILGASLNGAFIIEVLFVYPGLGHLFILAMGVRDFNVMQGIVVFSIFTVLTLTLIVDLALPLFDPRIKRAR